MGVCHASRSQASIPGTRNIAVGMSLADFNMCKYCHPSKYYSDNPRETEPFIVTEKGYNPFWQPSPESHHYTRIYILDIKDERISGKITFIAKVFGDKGGLEDVNTGEWCGPPFVTGVNDWAAYNYEKGRNWVRCFEYWVKGEYKNLDFPEINGIFEKGDLGVWEEPENPPPNFRASTWVDIIWDFSNLCLKEGNYEIKLTPYFKKKAEQCFYSICWEEEKSFEGLPFAAQVYIPPLCPNIVNHNPLNETSTVSIDTAISITFNRSMDQSATQSAFSIEPNVPGTFIWSNDNKTLFFQPSSHLLCNQQYTISLSSTATDTEGKVLDINENGAGGEIDDNYTFTFTTETISISLEGQVRDMDTEDFLEQVLIQLNEGQSQQTNSQGYYKFTDLQYGDYTLSAVKEGYCDYTEEVVLQNIRQKVIDIKLKPKEVPKPIITRVDREYEGIFLHGVSLENTYKVYVEWGEEDPNKITFTVLDKGAFSEKADQYPLSRLFDMGDDFMAIISPKGNMLTIGAQNNQGGLSDPWVHYPHVIPMPGWLTWINNTLAELDKGEHLSFNENRYEPAYTLTFTFPEEPWDGKVTIPDWLPYIGGKEFGIKETQAKLNVKINLSGKGNTEASGQTGFTIADQESAGKGTGKGDIIFDANDGLTFNGMAINLNVSQSIQEDWFIIEFIPVGSIIGKLLNKVPPLKNILSAAKIGATISPAVDLGLHLKEKEEDGVKKIGFESVSGGAGLTLGGSFNLEVEKISSEVTAELDGTGSVIYQIPANPSYIKEVMFTIRNSSTIKIWSIINSKATVIFYTKYTDASGWEGGVNYESEVKGLERKLKGIQDQLFEPISTDFLTRGYSTFVANQPVMTRDVPAEYGMLTINKIIENVYPYSEAKLIEKDDSLLLCFIYYDPNDPVLQATEVAYTAYDGQKWCSPLPIADDTRGEFNPRLSLDKHCRAIAVWQRIKDENFDSLDLYEMASQMEIVWAKYDFDTDIWSAPAALTDNVFLDGNPLLCSDYKGNVALVWESNQDNELMGDSNSPSDFHFTLWHGNTWESPQMILSNQANAFGHTLAMWDEGILVWSMDVDGNFSTTNDQDLYYLLYDGTTWTGPSRLTNDNVSDHPPRAVYDSAGKLYLTWIRDGRLVLLDDLATGGYQIIRENSGTAQFLNYKLAVNNQGNLVIFWQQADDLGNDIFYILYDPTHDHWSKDTRLLQDDDVEKYYVPLFSSTGDLIMAYNKDIIEYVTETVEVNGEEVFFENVARSLRNDLYVLRYTFCNDLSIQAEGITFSHSSPRPGDTVTISADIKNSGNFSLDNVIVHFYDQTPFQQDFLIGSVTLTDPLSAGGSQIVSIDWCVPEGEDTHEIFVILDPRGNIVEKDETNNILSAVTVLPDFALLGGKVTQSGNFLDILVEVKNEGSVPSFYIPLEYRLNSPDGALLASKTISFLSLDESAEKLLRWDITEKEYPDGPLSICVQVDPENIFLEKSKENNFVKIHVMDTTPPEVTCPQDILITKYTPSGAIVEFNASGQDNLDHTITFTSNPSAGSIFPLNDTLVSCTAADDYGNTASCSFTISVPPLQNEITLWPGLNLLSLPPEIEILASSLWNNLAHASIQAAKIQAKNAQWRTFENQGAEDFYLIPGMSWMAYFTHTEAVQIQMDYTPALLSLSGNTVLDLLPGVNVVNYRSLLKWINSSEEHQAGWPEKVFQRAEEENSPVECISGYDAQRAKWAGKYHFFGRTAGSEIDVEKMKNEGYIVYKKNN